MIWFKEKVEEGKLNNFGFVYRLFVECVGFFICHFCKIQTLFLAQVETMCQTLEAIF